MRLFLLMGYRNIKIMKKIFVDLGNYLAECGYYIYPYYILPCIHGDTGQRINDFQNEKERKRNDKKRTNERQNKMGKWKEEQE